MDVMIEEPKELEDLQEIEGRLSCLVLEDNLTISFDKIKIQAPPKLYRKLSHLINRHIKILRIGQDYLVKEMD